MARRNEKPRFYVRKFINKPGHHTVAFVLVKVGKGGDIDFTLSDCQRMVSLEFPSYSNADRKNSLYKVETLIEVLTGFKAALETYYTERPLQDGDYD